MNPAPYDHARKAGNPGDLFKHAILAYVASKLARSGVAFRYVESHVGRPLYRLREGGEWMRGAGALSGLSEGAGPLFPYWRHALAERTPTAGSLYPGSALLLHRVVSAAGGSPRMTLWDHDPEVVAAMRSHFADSDGVEVMEGDGYRGVATVERADLALVDPIGLESRPVTELLERLQSRSVPFLCWVPRRGDDRGREEAVSRRFRALMLERYAVESVRWGAWHEGTHGCHVIVSPPLRTLTAEAAKAVREVLGWEE